jgi:hypothetical protein
MRVHSPRRVSQNPLAVAIGVSIGLHLLLLAAVLLARAPENNLLVKRGEPLFIELPEVDESAQRGAPAAQAAPKAPPTPPAPTALPTPPAPPAPPAPQVAKAPPQRPSPPQPPAPERPSVASAQPRAAPPVPLAPDGQAPSVAREQPKPAEPNTSEPSREPEAQAREIPRAAPPPRVAAIPPESRPDIRSALRRGGPGGAGGFGEGRGGIVGNPIPLDTRDPRYSDYFLRIQQMIQAKMSYPCVKNPTTLECEHRPAQLLVEFGILKDGQLQFVEVVRGADYAIFDDYSVNAIKLAAPFPPVPASLMETLKPGTTGVPVAARFVYVLESSFRGLVR